jgi:regulation of enolase protein 1 (concanavalin A-like superfamily)
MDTTGLKAIPAHAKTCILLCTAILLVTGCGSDRQVTTSSAPTVTTTPLPPAAEPVQSPVNVSFSTYSKDWPVGWQWIDPDESRTPTPHDVKKGVLRVRIPSGKDLNSRRQNAPRYIKPITGDFQIETRVNFNPTENYQGAGLLVYADDRNFLRFERGYGGAGGGAGGVRVDLRKNGEYRPLVTPDNLQTEVTELDLKLVRTGPTFTAYWRVDEESEWREAASVEVNWRSSVFTGIVACNTAREAVAEFQYIRLLPVPK